MITEQDKKYYVILNHQEMGDINLSVWVTINQHRVFSGDVINAILLTYLKKKRVRQHYCLEEVLKDTH